MESDPPVSKHSLHCTAKSLDCHNSTSPRVHRSDGAPEQKREQGAFFGGICAVEHQNSFDGARPKRNETCQRMVLQIEMKSVSETKHQTFGMLCFGVKSLGILGCLLYLNANLTVTSVESCALRGTGRSRHPMCLAGQEVDVGVREARMPSSGGVGRTYQFVGS